MSWDTFFVSFRGFVQIFSWVVADHLNTPKKNTKYITVWCDQNCMYVHTVYSMCVCTVCVYICGVSIRDSAYMYVRCV